MFYVIEGIGPLRVAGHLGDLPWCQLGVDILGQRLALDFQSTDFFRNIECRIVLSEAELLDFGFEFGDRLLEFEEGDFHGGYSSN